MMKITITLEGGQVLEVKNGVFYGQGYFEGMSERLTQRAKSIGNSPIYPSRDYQIALDTADFLGLPESCVTIEGEPDPDNQTDEFGRPLIY